MKPTPSDLRALAQRDPALGRVLESVPRFPSFPSRDDRAARTHYCALARAIVYQQLHGKAAATIHARLVALTPGVRFPKPEEILELSDRRLLGAGLSRNKLAALRDLAERIVDGRLVLRDVWRHSDDAIVERLTAVHGIGAWSAQMFLMFRLGRLDVMAPTDLGVQEGMRMLDGMPRRPTPREALERAEVWRPLRTVACWAMWRLVERERDAAKAGASAVAERPSRRSARGARAAT